MVCSHAHCARLLYVTILIRYQYGLPALGPGKAGKGIPVLAPFVYLHHFVLGAWGLPRAIPELKFARSLGATLQMNRVGRQ